MAKVEFLRIDQFWKNLFIPEPFEISISVENRTGI